MPTHRRPHITGGDQLDARLPKRKKLAGSFRHLRPVERRPHRLGPDFMVAQGLEKGDIIELQDGRHVTILTQAYSFNTGEVHLEILGDDGRRAEYQLRFFLNAPVKVVYTPNARQAS